MKKIIFVSLLLGCLFGCSGIPMQQAQQAPMQQAMVIGVQYTTFTENTPNLVGAAVGGTAGGVLGHQFGKGNGKTAMTILGAIGGAAVGSQVNANQTVQGYAVTFRGNNGEMFTVNTKSPLQVGQTVNYRNENNHIVLQ